MTTQIGCVRLAGLSCSIPYFVKKLAAWIDLDRPPTGIQLLDLEDSGHVPDQSTTYRYRIVKNYKMKWWAVPGQGSASLIQSWKPTVQEALTVFLAQVCASIPTYSNFHTLSGNTYPVIQQTECWANLRNLTWVIENGSRWCSDRARWCPRCC
jgi:hypothetical protein